MKIQKFNEFINEWDIRGHWGDERGSLSHEFSRIVPLSPGQKDGWTCTQLIELDANGIETDTKIDISDFLQLSRLDKEEFNKRVTFALYTLTHSSRIDRKNYRDEKHRYIFLGKLGFIVKVEEYAPTGEKTETVKTYSPILSVKKESQGNQVWGAIRGNKGPTFLYFKPKMSVGAIEKIGHHSYTSSEKSYIDDAIYRKNLWAGIDFLHDENFVLTIPQVENWEELVKKYADQGMKFEFPTTAKKYERNEELEKWKSYMKGNETTFDIGTELWVKGFDIDAIMAAKKAGKELTEKPMIEEIKTIVELDKVANTMSLATAKGSISKKPLPKPGETVEIVSNEKEGLRKAGGLPENGTLIKLVRVESYRNGKTEKGVPRNKIYGPILDYYVILSDGTKIVSPL